MPPQFCRMLLQAGANLMAQDNVNLTPLHYATQKGYHECVNQLQRYGSASRPASAPAPRLAGSGNLMYGHLRSFR
jgi:ankyrin repeat protein